MGRQAPKGNDMKSLILTLTLSAQIVSGAEMMEVDTPQKLADEYILADGCERLNAVQTDKEFVELIHEYDDLDLVVNCDDPNASEQFKAERKTNEKL